FVGSFAPMQVTHVVTRTMPGGEFRIVGQAVNQSGATIGAAFVYATLYDSASKVIGCSQGTTNAHKELADGVGSYFIVRFTGADFSAGASYYARVLGALPPATKMPYPMVPRTATPMP